MGFRDGVVGFFLFFAHWLSPETGRAGIDIDFSNYLTSESAIYKCKLDIAWNKQLENLVDAGIPLCYKISYYTDISDSVIFIVPFTSIWLILHINLQTQQIKM